MLSPGSGLPGGPISGRPVDVPITNEIYPGDPDHPTGPYGLGIRVPMIIVSPWTRGGWVNSELLDHTSMIRFLEGRFAHHRPDLIETNITPWRRAVTGDLTSAFDFRTPNASRHLRLPDTDAFKPEDLVRHADEVPVPPVDEKLPRQEQGVRPARALPYALHAHGDLNEADGSFRIQFRNVGKATGVFQVRSGNSADAPRTYTVEPREGEIRRAELHHHARNCESRLAPRPGWRRQHLQIEDHRVRSFEARRAMHVVSGFSRTDEQRSA